MEARKKKKLSVSKASLLTDREIVLALLLNANYSSVIKFQPKRKDRIIQNYKNIAQGILDRLKFLNGSDVDALLQEVPTFAKDDELGVGISNNLMLLSLQEKNLNDLNQTLEDLTRKFMREDWLKTSLTDMLPKIQKVTTFEDLSKVCLEELSRYIKASEAIFYIKLSEVNNLASDSFEIIGTFGLDIDKTKSEFRKNDSLISQCGFDMRLFYTDSSSDGRKHGERCTLIYPLVYDEQRVGYLEFSTDDFFTDLEIKLVEMVSNSISISVHSLSSRTFTEKLLSEILKKNSMLDSQKKALDSSAIVAETNIKGEITYANDKFLEISKYERDEVIGQDHRILNSMSHSKAFFHVLWKTILKGQVWRGEVKNRAKDGSFYWVDTTIYPVKDEFGKLQKFVAIRFDITDKKRVMEELLITTKLAESAVKEKGEFLANMSHEIRTPMNAIIGIPDVLYETDLSDEQRKYVKMFQKSGRILLGLMDGILDLAKIEDGQFALESETFNLKKLIGDIVMTSENSALAKNISLSYSYNPSLSESFLGDHVRIQQVLMNLIGNALKFTESGTINVSFTENVNKGISGNILVSIKDTGIGISEENITKLFKAFTQADSSITRKFGGTGLGLLICKKLVESMNGQIWVESVFGEGTNFFFTLDLPPMINDEVVPVSKIGRDIDVIRKPLNILLVDDSEDNRILVLAYFKKSFHQITEVVNGQEAFEIAKNKHFDLILMDIQMPVLDGLSATKLIRDWEKDNNTIPVPIIALTANIFKEEVSKCFDAGCSEYLSKPIKKNILFDAIAKLCN